MIGIKLLNNMIRMTVDISTANIIGTSSITQKSATSLWHAQRVTCVMSKRKEHATPVQDPLQCQVS
eukprot:8144707-Ditylum_brightwellii.AAC.1